MQQPGYCVGSRCLRVFRACNSITCIAIAVLLSTLFPALANCADRDPEFVLQREDRTIVPLEPYGPNIIRITSSITKSLALTTPGYGIIGKPSSEGWDHEQDSSGYDVVRSGRMTIRVAPANLHAPHPMPLDSLNQKLRDHVFYDEAAPASTPQRCHINNDSIRYTAADNAALADGPKPARDKRQQRKTECGFRLPRLGNLRRACDRALLRLGPATAGRLPRTWAQVLARLFRLGENMSASLSRFRGSAMG